MAYKIILATGDLVHEGISYPGCPIFLRDWDICLLPSLWTMSLWGDDKRATARTYATSLRQWLEWLEFRKIEWWSVDVEDAKRYRAIKRQKLSTSSVNVALAAICAFYAWAYDAGHIPFCPFGLASVGKSAGRSDVAALKLGRVFKKLRKTHTKTQFDTILANSTRLDAGLLRRDELVAEFGRACGMRRSEISGLTLGSMQQGEVKGDFYVFTIVNTKGGKRRLAYISCAFRNRVLNYVKTYRSRIAARYGVSEIAPMGPLFLTAYGKPLRAAYISQSWTLASQAAGIASRFHNNRHTMATRVIEACDQAGIHPYRIAQDLLGHAHTKTTRLYDWSRYNEETRSVFDKIMHEAWNDKK